MKNPCRPGLRNLPKINLVTIKLKANSTHIVPTINREASGPSYSVSRLCQSLRNSGHPTKLAVLEPLPTGYEGEFVTAFPYGLGPKRLGFSPKMKRWLRTDASSGQTHILHNHSLWMATNVYPAKAVRNTTCKLVVSPRGTLSTTALKRSALLKKTLWPFILTPAIRTATAFHATSEQEYHDIRKQGLRQPVAIIPNGIDVPVYVSKEPLPLRQLLFLGRIHPVKGIDLLLRAWAAVQQQHTNWQLVIAGPDEGGYLAKMQKLARELKLERCEFVGALYGEKKWRAYQKADLYVLPTHTENFGITVAEALAAGTPVITTKGAPWQGLETQRTGWWIDIGVAPLIATLDQALGLPPEILEQKGLLGRDWMTQDFSWHTIANDMSAFYDWLINGGKIPPFVRVD